MTFEPRIVGFLCNWCSYAGADLAEVSRISYPTNIRIMRLTCSGRADPVIVLETLAQGADGVMVMGCHIGDCHYQKGNFMMEKRFSFLKNVIQMLGIESERVRLEWISASEGGKFATLIREMTNQIKKLEPSPFRKLNPQTGEGGKP
jgi:F420-non-reducing hydrogenase iron-sulfur subunit